eukprot:2525280-Rhodomonas_salina.1
MSCSASHPPQSPTTATSFGLEPLVSNSKVVFTKWVPFNLANNLPQRPASDSPIQFGEWAWWAHIPFS